jgi:hypothetical protein
MRQGAALVGRWLAPARDAGHSTGKFAPLSEKTIPTEVCLYRTETSRHASMQKSPLYRHRFLKYSRSALPGSRTMFDCIWSEVRGTLGGARMIRGW